MIEDTKSTSISRYRQLIRVLHELASILNTDLLVDQIIASASNLCDTEAVWVLFPDRNNHSLVLDRGNFDKNVDYQGLSFPIADSMEGWVYVNQRQILIDDLSSYDQSFGGAINLPGTEIKSILAIPLNIKDKTIGVLELANKKTKKFSKLDQEILVSFASQAAIYVDNTRRFLQSDLLNELVHELRTPLAALNTALYLLQRHDLPDDRREQISQMIHNEFSRLTELTTSFLEYARMESGRAQFNLTQFDLTHTIIESVDIVQMQLEGKGIKISVDFPAYPLIITADQNKIKQVILNLLSNAIKYNLSGGVITVTANNNPNEIYFSIHDNGQGIPPESLPHLFERFYRVPNTETRAKGTGLGLTICKQIIEAHNGRIEVSSIIGQGTTFTVHLPVS
jgi:signal transduction histidine kinase